MDLARFCSLVHASDQDLVEFVARTLDVEPLGLIEHPEGQEPDFVRRARIRAELGVDEGTIEASHLLAMDKLRYDDPWKALDGIAAVIDFIPAQNVPLALGIYASCCRPLLRLREAWFAIHIALRLEAPLSSTRASLYQRAASLHRESCDYKRALATSEQATVTYARQGDLSGVGQTLIDQGTLLWYLNRREPAEQSFRAGLEMLGPSEQRHRCAGLHSLALLLYYDGRSPEALESVSQASPLASTMVERGKIEWLEACCLADAGRTPEAFEILDRAFENLRTAAPVDAAMLTCDQVRLMLESGKTNEAYQRARAVRRLIIPLEKRDPKIAAAALDLAAVELAADRRLTLDLVDEVQKRIRDASTVKPQANCADPLASPF